MASVQQPAVGVLLPLPVLSRALLSVAMHAALVALLNSWLLHHLLCTTVFVVGISVVDIAVELAGVHSGPLSIFRVFRLLRVFKLARSWSALNRHVMVPQPLVVAVLSLAGMCTVVCAQGLGT